MSKLDELNKATYEDRKLFAPKVLQNIVKKRIPPSSPLRVASIKRSFMGVGGAKETERHKSQNLFPEKFKNIGIKILDIPMPTAKAPVGPPRESVPANVSGVPSAMLMRIKKTVQQKINPEQERLSTLIRAPSPTQFEDFDSSVDDVVDDLYNDLPEALITLGEQLAEDTGKSHRFPVALTKGRLRKPVIPTPIVPLETPPTLLPPIPDESFEEAKARHKSVAEQVEIDTKERIRRHKSIAETLIKAQELMRDKLRLLNIKIKIQEKLEKALFTHDDNLLKALQEDLKEIEIAYKEILAKQQALQEEEFYEEEESESSEEMPSMDKDSITSLIEANLRRRTLSFSFPPTTEPSTSSIGTVPSVKSVSSRKLISLQTSASSKSLSDRKSLLQIKQMLSSHMIHDKFICKLAPLFLRCVRKRDASFVLEYLKEIQKLELESEFLEKTSKKFATIFPFDYSFGPSLGEFQFDAKYKYPHYVDELELGDFANPMRRAEYYLYSRRIRELFEFLGAHLVAQQPANPIQFLIEILDRCMEYRRGCITPPLLFDLKHIESLYKSLDPMKTGEITLDQYNTGLYTFGLLPKTTPSETSSIINDHLMVFKDIFIKDVYKKLKEQLDLMISIPSLKPTNYFPCKSSSFKDVRSG